MNDWHQLLKISSLIHPVPGFPAKSKVLSRAVRIDEGRYCNGRMQRCFKDLHTLGSGEDRRPIVICSVGSLSLFRFLGILISIGTMTLARLDFETQAFISSMLNVRK